jgi:hypothetical protein
MYWSLEKSGLFVYDFQLFKLCDLISMYEAGRMAQVVECLPSKPKALSSNPSMAK